MLLVSRSNFKKYPIGGVSKASLEYNYYTDDVQ